MLRVDRFFVIEIFLQNRLQCSFVPLVGDPSSVVDLCSQEVECLEGNGFVIVEEKTKLTNGNVEV